MAAVVLTLVVVGCNLLGGSRTPRLVDPNAVAPSPPPGAASWASLDWQEVMFEQPAKRSEEQWDQPSAVATGPGGWVAVGSNGDVGGYVGRIWQSADSLSWDLVDSELLAGLELVSVAATDNEYIAVGTRGFKEPTASILRSTDGLVWSEAETVPSAWGHRVAAGRHWFAAILGVDEQNDLLLSRDGLAWERVHGRDIGPGVVIADIAWDGDGWVAAGSAGDRAVVLRSSDGRTWDEETVPASEPVEGVDSVTAYEVVPGRWATLLLGLGRGPSCAEDDDWCDKYQAAWSWRADTGWQRLPKANWLLGLGHGVNVYTAEDAGFLYLLGDDVRTSADGWEWTAVEESSPSDAFPISVVVDADRVVAVGIPATGGDLVGWFGSASIGQ